MQKRKFDELISHFNRKVSDMGIDQKYKMELLGMISAIGFAHEKELGTNLAEVGTDLTSRQQAIDALSYCQTYLFDSKDYDKKISREDAAYAIEQLPSAQLEVNPADIDYYYCSNALLKMWIDNVLTDGEYNKIMDKLNDFERRRRQDENG